MYSSFYYTFCWSHLYFDGNASGTMILLWLQSTTMACGECLDDDKLNSKYKQQVNQRESNKNRREILLRIVELCAHGKWIKIEKYRVVHNTVNIQRFIIILNSIFSVYNFSLNKIQYSIINAKINSTKDMKFYRNFNCNSLSVRFHIIL